MFLTKEKNKIPEKNLNERDKITNLNVIYQITNSKHC